MCSVARSRVGLFPGDRDDVVDVAQHGAGPVQDECPGGGQRHALRVAFQQLDAQLSLQLLDLHGQRRLADVARLGGPTEVAVVGDGDEVLEGA